MDSVVDVTLSIVSHGTRDALRDCLRSIEGLSNATRVRTIVVDNASADGSADMVARDFPWAELVRNSTNRYFSCAHNQALKLTRGRYVGFLNSDTVLFPDTIERMVTFMDAHPSAAASTCLYVREDGTPLKAEVHNHWRFHSLWFHTLCRNGAGERMYLRLGGAMSTPIDQQEDWVETDVVSDTFLFARKEVLDRIGGFDERLALYATEDDICASIKRAGGRIFFYGGARLVHALSVSTRRANPFRIRWILAKDVITYHLKNGSSRSRVLAAPLLLAAFIIDAAVIVSRRGQWK
jgi:GT2 family glycosyltransferase